jgi:hypothetical protein
MKVNLREVIECGDKLYYDINPSCKMNIPSMFYEMLEQEWIKWKDAGSELSFYEFCKSNLKVQ